MHSWLKSRFTQTFPTHSGGLWLVWFCDIGCLHVFTWYWVMDSTIRRNNIRIRGLKVKKEDDCCKAVTEFIRNTLKEPITDADIEVAHIEPVKNTKESFSTLSRPTAKSKDPTVIIRFLRREICNKVICQRKLLKDSGITVVEDLTQFNLEVINRLQRTSQTDKTIEKLPPTERLA